MDEFYGLKFNTYVFTKETCANNRVFPTNLQNQELHNCKVYVSHVITLASIKEKIRKPSEYCSANRVARYSPLKYGFFFTILQVHVALFFETKNGCRGTYYTQ